MGLNRGSSRGLKPVSLVAANAALKRRSSTAVYMPASQQSGGHCRRWRTEPALSLPKGVSALHKPYPITVVCSGLIL